MEGSDFRKFYQYRNQFWKALSSLFSAKKNKYKNSRQFLNAEREPFKKVTLLLGGINPTWKSNYEVR